MLCFTTILLFMERIAKRETGQYKLSYEISFTINSEKPFFITEQCGRINEKLITAKPEYWLWTHRRWKFSESGQSPDYIES